VSVSAIDQGPSLQEDMRHERSAGFCVLVKKIYRKLDHFVVIAARRSARGRGIGLRALMLLLGGARRGGAAPRAKPAAKHSLLPNSRCYNRAYITGMVRQ